MPPSDKSREPLTDPVTGSPLAQKEQPGYYRGFSTLSQKAYWDEATRALVIDRVEKIPPIRFFTPAEASTMEAVVDRIIPQEDRIESRRIPIFSILDERLFVNRIEGYRYEDMPSDQEAYRIGAQAIEETAQALHQSSFANLDTLQQEQILQTIHDAKPLAAQQTWARMNIERFWQLLISDCCNAYYAHPWAWDEIGFGGPAYPRGYMRLERGEPEPWEVGEQPYAWVAPADTISDLPQQQGSTGENQSHQGQGGTH